MRLRQYIKVKVGEYNKGGKTVGKYVTVGKVLTDANGKDMVLLDRTFNPAGCPNDGREGIILNFWDAEEKQEQTPHNEAKANAYQTSSLLDEDSIPF
jgi:hypothetical protein